VLDLTGKSAYPPRMDRDQWFARLWIGSDMIVGLFWFVLLFVVAARLASQDEWFWATICLLSAWAGFWGLRHLLRSFKQEDCDDGGNDDFE
jgi:hypothetical protein